MNLSVNCVILQQQSFFYGQQKKKIKEKIETQLFLLHWFQQCLHINLGRAFIVEQNSGKSDLSPWHPLNILLMYISKMTL